MTDRDFNRNFIISFSIHLCIGLLAYLGGEFLKNAFKSNDVEIIRSSVRVDVVGMPKFTVQELKAMQKEMVEAQSEESKGSKTETKMETADIIKKGDLVIEEESKKKKTSFLNLISDYSNKKVAFKESKKGSPTGVSSKDLNNLILEGNRLSKGSSLVGEFSDLENSEFSSYVQTIPDQVRKFWKLPSYLKDQNLKCRIKIYLSNDGKLLKMDLIESSGQGEFDARAQNALKEASPFMRPSESVAVRLSSYGIILGFPL